MSTEPNTISKNKAPLESMDYDTLREVAIAHIQERAGKIWTDYNTHDPGVTIVEQFCYVITDLAYRLNFDMKDLLSNEIGDTTDYKNFFTAREILHNAPVTILDFRKLLMDIAVEIGGKEFDETIGIKNAWLKPSTTAEVKLYSDQANEELTYEPTLSDTQGFFVKGLYDIIIEFDYSLNYGDLNSNALSGLHYITDLDTEAALNGVEAQVNITFPRWDNEDVDWNDETNQSIIDHIQKIEIDFDEVPSGYELKEVDESDHSIDVAVTKLIAGNPVAIDMEDLSVLNAQITAFCFEDPASLLYQYKEKVAIIRSLVKLANCRLHDNRPLCEDFLNLKALKIEEIAFCGDIELDNQANVNEVAAQIYYNIGKFLSPDVYFYSLKEMEEKGYTTDEVFNGPKLQHGFIEDAELYNSELPCNLRASDLIQIIMDTEIDGKKVVKSIRGLQMANFPQDNDGAIAEKIVRWCLELAISKDYIPRLSLQKSNFTFYKAGLPFGADESNTEDKIDVLIANERKRYPENPILDRSIPKGVWRETNDYTSIMEDFPSIYGIGSAGIPNLPTEKSQKETRQALALQMQGFMSFFDQLLYNYLQQFTGIKSLFSMNQSVNQWGDLVMDKTYFTKPLVGKRFNELNSNPADDDADTAANIFVINDVVPNASDNDLFAHQHDKLGRMVQDLSESKEQFIDRKNKFLDHLLARFSEQFSDYALLQFSMEGTKAGEELIKDKLAFLNAYPQISANRGQAFNYRDGLLWHRQNISGYEKRCQLLLGINEPLTDVLKFTKRIKIQLSAGVYSIFLMKGAAKLLQITNTPDNNKEALSLAEEMVAAGCNFSNYSIEELPSGKFLVHLKFNHCAAEINASSSKKFNTEALAISYIRTKCMESSSTELIENVLANRHNIAPPILDYFKIKSYTVDTTTTPHLATVNYELYDKPLWQTGEKRILKGTIEGPVVSGANAAETKQFTTYSILWKLVRFASDADYYKMDPETASNFPVSYHFTLIDNYGNVIGVHTGKNYNKPLADVIKNIDPNELIISSSTGNDGTYTINNAVAEGPFIYINVDEAIPSNRPDGSAKISEELDALLDAGTRKLTVTGVDLTDRLYVNDSLLIKSGGAIVQSIGIRQISLEGGNTIIISDQALEPNISTQIKYERVFKIRTLKPKKFIVWGGNEQKEVADFISFINQTFIEREGLHVTENMLLRPKTDIDPLFDITTDAECDECNISDVYSFILTVVLPYWPSRFLDLNFREFIEKSIRQETPAHLAMNLCWVNPLHMFIYEKAVKEWLCCVNDTLCTEDNRKEKLQALIKAIQQLRSVYPSGRLHDCEQSDISKNAIILNKTTLGTF